MPLRCCSADSLARNESRVAAVPRAEFGPDAAEVFTAGDGDRVGEGADADAADVLTAF